MIEIYNGNVLVAKTVLDDDGNETLYIEDTGTGLEIPFNLFGSFKKGRVDIIKFSKWLETRIFPKGRCGEDELLKKMGLEEYSVPKMVKLTNARMFQDDFWVKWS